jgi:hypothetical protein
MPTQITSAGITFNDATSFTSAVLAANSVGATQITNGSVTAAKLGTNEQKQICKAWVNFDGTTSPGTIRSSYNVSSVTRIATGRYSVNFTTPMTDANYSVSGSCEAIFSVDDTTGSPFGLSSSLIATGNASAITNETYVCVSIFGN